jgi:hypothetical protein
MLSAFALSWQSVGTGGMGGSGTSVFEETVFCRAESCPEPSNVVRAFCRRSPWADVLECVLLFENMDDNENVFFFVVQKHESWLSDMSATRDVMVAHGRSLATLPADLPAAVQRLEGDSENWIAVFKCLPDLDDEGTVQVCSFLFCVVCLLLFILFLSPFCMWHLKDGFVCFHDMRLLVGCYNGDERVALPSELRRCARSRALPSLRVWGMISNRAQLCRDVRNLVGDELLEIVILKLLTESFFFCQRSSFFVSFTWTAEDGSQAGQRCIMKMVPRLSGSKMNTNRRMRII